MRYASCHMSIIVRHTIGRDNLLLGLNGLWVMTDASTFTWAVMWQFRYIEGILGALVVYAHPIVLRWDVDQIFEAFYDHLVPKDVWCVLASHPCSAIYNYIKFFYRVSHSYMTPDAKEDPPMPILQEILEEEQARATISLMCYWFVSVLYPLRDGT